MSLVPSLSKMQGKDQGAERERQRDKEFDNDKSAGRGSCINDSNEEPKTKNIRIGLRCLHSGPLPSESESLQKIR